MVCVSACAHTCVHVFLMNYMKMVYHDPSMIPRPYFVKYGKMRKPFDYSDYGHILAMI